MNKKGEKMNKREEILAEINMLKVMLFYLWEEKHGEIDNKDWYDLKKEVVIRMRKSETSDNEEK